MGDGSLRLGYGQGRAGKANSRETVSENRYLGQAKGEPALARVVLQTLSVRLGPKGEEAPTPGLPENGCYFKTLSVR